MLSKIKQSIIQTLLSYKKIDQLYYREQYDHKHPRVNLGQLQAEWNKSKVGVKQLQEVEFQVFSQFGDDGIIQFLIHHLPIKNKTFIEFGVENYREANTRFLLINNYWSGLVIDGSKEHVEDIRKSGLSAYYDLRAVDSFITKENINELMSSSGFDPEIGLLSIDIDGMDYWVWKELNVLRPNIIICEYNALFGFEEEITMPYRPDFVRGKHSPFQLYGTSLAAAVALAKTKGYFFIGSNAAGNNAYFISEQLRSSCPFPEITAKEGYRFACFSESRDRAGLKNRGKNKLLSVDQTEVYDCTTQQTKLLQSEKIIQSLQQAGKFNGIH